ncbi:MAG: hypothetical protein IKI84_01245 [Clostridia bacterium]|nr:hypothetical protein [Clostridia bacterium]
MPDREKVIRGLECHVSGKCEAGSDSKYICPYWEDNNCSKSVMNDALWLLKAQEPRVLTWEEVQNDCPDYVYLEWHGYCICCIKDEGESDKSVGYFVYGIEGDYFQFLWYTYGVIWRCWTAMPTDEQREAVKWDG